MIRNDKINKDLVPNNFLAVADDASRNRDAAINLLLETRKLPENGWSDTMIEVFVHQLAFLDTNNFPKRCGMGEREGRVICDLVRRRHYNLSHGIGRSGNLTEPQPKAAGSTLLANLTNRLVLDLIRMLGVRSCRKALVVPMATGMTMTLTLLAIKAKRPKAKYVLWSRVDQKSCFKSITAAGLTPVVIDSVVTEGTAFSTYFTAFRKLLERDGPSALCCILSTTSAFAPRGSDDIIALAKLCQQYDLPHVVNNAYGLQSSYFTHQLEQASLAGRIDAFVQSTDKNLLVPVGGAIVAGFEGSLVDDIAEMYPGRASSSQSLDVLMTLLSTGKNGYQKLIDERKLLHSELKERLEAVAASYGERILACKNPISIAMSLSSFGTEDVTMIGSMLQKRGVSGCRVVCPGESKTIGEQRFMCWGVHHSGSDTTVPYLTASAALGISRPEIDHFFGKLPEVLDQFRARFTGRPQ